MKTFSISSKSHLASTDFTWGVATSAFQIEGHKEKSFPCIWDEFCSRDGTIRDLSDGSEACNHVMLWEDDIQMIASLGVDAYRFSVSWARVIDNQGRLIPTGVAFYLKLLNALNELNIKAYVTLYHWDLPLYHQKNGGWLNRETAYRFAEYVDLITQAFGDRVYSYTTLNEPFCSAYLGHELGIHAPGIADKAAGKIAAHHLLLAHGLAMQKIRYNAPNVEAGIVLNFSPTYPASNSDADIRAAYVADNIINHWYLSPVLKGKYPEIFSELEGTQAIDMHSDDMLVISQPVDFIGVNYYSPSNCQASESADYTVVTLDESLPKTAMGWDVYPRGLYELLRQLDEQYELPPLIITENGAAFDDIEHAGVVDDQERMTYLQSHFDACEDAIRDGVNVKGYFVWSLMDNFEWAEGYTKRFGIVYVDYTTQKRIKKTSALALQEFLSQRKNRAR